jgi:hypothetical protein
MNLKCAAILNINIVKILIIHIALIFSKNQSQV